VLAEVSGNRILLLLIRILTAQLSAQHSLDQGSPQSLFEVYLQHLHGIIAAIQAGDVMLARRATTGLHRFIADLHPQRLSPTELAAPPGE
jgi:DNA-binding FadR family transcriptional regulator